ncbi:MAG: PilZ domain-containing protein [Candidatus Omnitrophica bacterium]|nr:PilZ domain-containing protein [Candidatus Omnitrophota bacterium]
MKENKLYVQRRRLPRARYDENGILLSLGTRNFPGVRSIDLNVCGIGLKSPVQLVPGQKVSVQFPIAGAPSDDVQFGLIRASGSVQWQDPRYQEGYATGIHFDGLAAQNERAIEQVIFSEEMVSEEKVELESLQGEIQECAKNLLAIELGTWTVAVSLIAGSCVVLMQPLGFYFAFIPLFIPALGFKLFKSRLNEIRRIAAYIRAYIESMFPRIQWEGQLHYLRKILHKVEDRYTLTYYNVAMYLSGVCFSLGLYRLIDRYRQYSTMWDVSTVEVVWKTMVFFFVAMYWFSNILPQIKKHSKQHEGADAIEAKYLRYWERIRAYQRGFCTDYAHLPRALAVLNDSRLVIAKVRDELHTSCPYTKTCRVARMLARVHEKIAAIPQDELVTLKPDYSRQAYIVLITIWGSVAYSLGMIPWWFFLLFPLALLAGMVLIKVNVVKNYIPVYAVDQPGALRRLVRLAWLYHDDPELSSFVVRDLPEQGKMVPGLSWMFFYGMKDVFQRDKISFFVKRRTIKKTDPENEFFAAR